MQKITSNSHLDFSIINSNLDSSERPGRDLINLIGDVLEPHAPNGLSAVTLTTQSNAVEQAVSDAIQERGSDPSTAVLGFTGSSHGASLALAQFGTENNSSSFGWSI